MVVDNSAHGWASLGLATRIAHQQECELRLLSIETPGAKDDAELQEMLGVASAQVARVSAASMAGSTADELERQLDCPLVVIGGELADRLALATSPTGSDAPSSFTARRCSCHQQRAPALPSPTPRSSPTGAAMVKQPSVFVEDVDNYKRTVYRRNVRNG